MCSLLLCVRRDFTALQASHMSAKSRYHTIYGHSSTLGQNIRVELASGRYKTALDQPTLACAQRLPWWNQRHWEWQHHQMQRRHRVRSAERQRARGHTAV